MFIFIGCAGGGTSSMFCQRIVQEIQLRDANLTAVFDDVISVFEKQLGYGEAYDLVFAYGGIDAIRSYNAFEFGQLFDVIFVAPQVRYQTEKKRQLLTGYSTIIKDIPMLLFGQMNGCLAYRDLLNELILLDDSRGSYSGTINASKGTDKNMELLILGGSQEDSWVKDMLAYLASLQLRSLVEAYSLERLYMSEQTVDYDIRLLFGPPCALNKKELPKLARRVDGVMVAPHVKSSVAMQLEWLRGYQVPYLFLDDETYGGEMQPANVDLLDSFLVTVQLKTESTSEIKLDYLEVQPIKPRKTFLGIISWE